MNRRRQETHCTVNSKPGGIWLAEAWEACSSATYQWAGHRVRPYLEREAEDYVERVKHQQFV